MLLLVFLLEGGNNDLLGTRDNVEGIYMYIKSFHSCTANSCHGRVWTAKRSA